MYLFNIIISKYSYGDIYNEGILGGDHHHLHEGILGGDQGDTQIGL